MSAPDMDIIKEIPGYKVILKAVLKSQIQQLVEQLAAHTEEESIILTASVADGTLSHLGSDSGKSFLDDHEDVKSQFLGFCLKWHHKKKQEKDKEEAMHIAAENISPRFMPSRSPVQQFTRFHGSRGQSFRSPGMRHQPYPLARPMRAASVNPNTQIRTFSPLKSPNKIDEQIIKIEPHLNEETSNQCELNLTVQNNDNSSQPSSPSQTPVISSDVKNESSDKEDDAHSESSSPIHNDTPAEGLSLDSDLTSLILGSQTSSAAPQTLGSSDIDQNVCVKVEALTESEMDLEITGVEPGRAVVSQSSWTPNSSMGMNFDPLGATGSHADVQAAQQGYNCARRHRCHLCGYSFSRPSHLERHLWIHEGSKPFPCEQCGKSFRLKQHLRSHMLTHFKNQLPGWMADTEPY